jgi:hypothetical protein
MMIRIATLLIVLATALVAASQTPPTLAAAQARLQAQDPAGAAKILEQITAADPKNARAWRMLGVARHQAGDFDAAIRANETSLEHEPNHPVAFYNIGASFARKGEAGRAFEWLARAKATRRLDMTQIENDNDLKALRGDTRFAALLPTPADFENPFVEPTRVIREWTGEAANDQFGWIARSLGDVDADGVQDVVTSAPTKVIGGAAAGRVYVLSSKTGRRLWTSDGAPGDQFGIGVERAGDTNKDGVPDVIASAPGGGYARVLSGRDGRVLLTLKAEAASDQFGRHVSTAGDVNGDGYDDVLVGAPGHASAGARTGRAYLFSGRDGKPLLSLSGERAGDAFGSTVAGHTSNGRSTIIVGAPGGGPSRRGRAYVYVWTAESSKSSPQPLFTVDADDTGAALAAMFVSIPGDLDGDRTPDVYLSDFPNAAKGPSTGRIYVHSGADGRRLFTLTGETAGEGFGTSPSVAGDVNGDRVPDLIVGAWQYAGHALTGGRAYLYSGRNGSLIRTFTCRTPGDAFGFDAVGLGDVDGDDATDLLITSAWSGVKGFHSGRIFILSSK